MINHIFTKFFKYVFKVPFKIFEMFLRLFTLVFLLRFGTTKLKLTTYDQRIQYQLCSAWFDTAEVVRAHGYSQTNLPKITFLQLV